VKERVWIKTKYFTRVPTTATCARPECSEVFEYVRTSKPRKYCPACARLVQLEQMRENNRWMRDFERQQREVVNA
jgi:hypothetical protein